MSKKTAGELRRLAAELEQAEARAPQSADEVLRRSGIEELCVDVSVQAEVLGFASFDLRKHMVQDASRQLGHHIAQTLDLKLVIEGGGLAAGTPTPSFAGLRQVRYRARIYALSPEKLRTLLQQAFSAGRASA